MDILPIKQRIKRALLSLPYRVKLVLIFSLLILTTATLLGSITYYQVAKSSRERTEEYQVQLADQINRNLDRYLKEMQIISLSPLYNQEVMDILENHQIPSDKTMFPPANERITLWRYISSLIHMRNEIKGIHIMANDGTIFSNLDSNTVMLKVFDRNSEWLKKINKADGEWVLLPLHQPNYYLRKDVTVFSVARLIRDPESYKPLGIMIIDLKQELIQDILSRTNLASRIFILNNENQFIYPKAKDKMIGDSILTEINRFKEHQHMNFSINQTDYLVVYNESSYSGVKTIMLTPSAMVLSEVNHLRKVVIVVVLLGIIISLLLGFMLSKPMVGSIYKLRKAMENVEKGNLAQRVSFQGYDEIGQLGKGFNHMINEIDRLVSEVYETGLREKEAEIKALQSQMNPHFLYNTLETINMLAVTKGNLEVSDMVSSLGRLLRYTIDNSSKIVTLKEELSFIQSYIAIQKVRMGENLKYEEEIEPVLHDVLIPKLVLQPLVENAIIHGLFGQGGLIVIKAASKNELLEIVIHDNGKGVPIERLEALKQTLETGQIKPNRNHTGIALPNVHERIQLLYGKEYGIEIASQEHNGFSILLKIPIQRRGAYENERNISC
ncbi:sensor histidine kinase [Neobacillus niacini]|uniref:sensor histidine kinase n=1 Tax=Neobacillus niacini TaxID=86668 RepID=UPI0021CB37CC|nr:sensor histidine kinase [Neobacillus niacini]MCM3766398.1 sensor histidine kinase [Neobacillus niacini]